MRFQPIIVPGWKDSGPDHWQTHWAQCLPHAQRVDQPNWIRPEPAIWNATVARYVERADSPVLLVAHSLGCLAVANLPVPLRAKVAAALLVAPPDVERHDAPDYIRCFGPVPQHSLCFQTMIVASDDDPFCSLARAKHFAAAWGGRLQVLSGAGHINAESGLHTWPQGLKWLAALRRRAGWRISSPLPRVSRVKEIVALPY